MRLSCCWSLSNTPYGIHWFHSLWLDETQHHEEGNYITGLWFWVWSGWMPRPKNRSDRTWRWLHTCKQRFSHLKVFILLQFLRLTPRLCAPTSVSLLYLTLWKGTENSSYIRCFFHAHNCINRQRQTQRCYSHVCDHVSFCHCHWFLFWGVCVFK